MGKLILTLDPPAYTGVEVIDIPDPDGFPIYEDPITSIRYRCLGHYFSPDALKAWLVFGIISDKETDPLFFGFVESDDGHKLAEFRRSEILEIASCAMEYDVEWLKKLEPPFYLVKNHDNISDDMEERLEWRIVDGKICTSDNLKENMN